MSGVRLLTEGAIMGVGLCVGVVASVPLPSSLQDRVPVVCTLLGLFGRTVWMFLLGAERLGKDTFERSRLVWVVGALCLPPFFAGFTYMTVQWSMVWGRLQRGNQTRITTYLIAFFLVALECSVSVVMVCLLLVFPEIRTDFVHPRWSMVRGIPIILESAVFFFVSVWLAWQGRHFYRQLKWSRGLVNDELGWLQSTLPALRKIVGLAVVCAMMFLLRACAHMHGLMVYDFKVIEETELENDINNVLFPTIYYTFPELVSALVLLLVLAPQRKAMLQNEARETEFAAPSYAPDDHRYKQNEVESEFVAPSFTPSFMPSFTPDDRYSLLL